MKVNVKLTRLTFSRSPEAGGQPQRERFITVGDGCWPFFLPPGTPEKATVDPYHPCQTNSTKGFVRFSKRTGTDGKRTGTDGRTSHLTEPSSPRHPLEKRPLGRDVVTNQCL